MKAIQLTFLNGEVKAFPLQVVAEHRAREYATPGTDEWSEEVQYLLEDGDEAKDWLGNNMPWSAIEPHLLCVKHPQPLNIEYEFMDCEMEVIDDFQPHLQIEIIFSNGEIWAIPVDVVAEHFARDGQSTGSVLYQYDIDFMKEDTDKAIDWLRDMPWTAIKPAIKLLHKPDLLDFQYEFRSSHMQIKPLK